MIKNIIAVDLFCGAGGTSEGLAKACNQLNYKLDLTAINHWSIAVDTHQLNHPTMKHLCENLDGVNPRKVFPKGKLDLLVASPECIFFSRARGGRAINEQNRATSWHICRWAEALDIKNILIENVPEYASWGPLGVNGRPLKKRKGEIFKAFTNTLISLGYNLEYKVLNAADYGDATSRRRLFILATKNRRPKWPLATHTKDGQPTLLGETLKWRAAREIIDWKLEGKSIFERKKPLSANTMRRIVAGLRKFCSKDLEPFIVKLYGTSDVASINKPLPTITGVNKNALCTPFLVEFYGNGKPQSVEKPVPTIPTKDRFGLCEPFVIRFTQTGAGDSPVHDVDKPLPTICTKQELAVVQPSFIIRTSHKEFDKSRVRSVDDPLPTVIATKQDLGICEPFIVRTDQTGQLGPGIKSVDAPLPTILTNPGLGVCEPFILPNEGFYRGNQPRSVDDPLNTVTSRGAGAIVQPVLEPFLVPQFGERENQTPRVHSIDKPLPAVTSHGAGALVMPEFNGMKLDIRFRMLEPHELAAAMSFDKDYEFAGNKQEVVKQIGNAVPVNLAKHLCLALLED